MLVKAQAEHVEAAQRKVDESSGIKAELAAALARAEAAEKRADSMQAELVKLAKKK